MSKESAASETLTQQEKLEALNYWVGHHVQDDKSGSWHLPFDANIPIPFGLSLHGLMLFIAAGLLIWVFCGVYDKKSRVPKGFTNLLETFILFIRDDISVPALGNTDGRKMAPLFCTFFFFIVTMNLMGLVPLFATATGNYNVTFALSMVTLGFMIIGGFIKNGPIGFWQAFIPHGVPWPVLIIIVPIEFLGMFIKAGALTIRLFANMLAGHIVLFSFIAMAVAFGIVVAPFALALSVCIYMLEILVAFLQAYIFTLLSAMFIGQVWHPEH